MSREHPTPDELEALLQHMYGGYGVELPHWYQPGMVKQELAEYQRSIGND
jgi:hypothetical protein